MMIVNDQSQRTRRLVALGAVCFILQLILAPNLAIAGGHPNFCLVFAFIASLLGGGVAPLWAAFVSGLFFDLTSSTPVGLMALLLVAASYGLNPQDRDRLVEEPVRAMRDSVGFVLIVELLYQLMLCLVGQGGSVVDVLFLRWLPACLWDCLVLVPFVVVYSRPANDVLTLGGSGKNSLQGKRYKL